MLSTAKMFTQGTLIQLGIFYKICNFLFAIPYKWNGNILENPSRARLVTFYLFCSWYLVTFLNLLMNLFQMLYRSLEVDVRQAFFNISYTAWYFLVCAMCGQICYYRKEMGTFINELLEANASLKRKYFAGESGKVRGDQCEILIRLSTPCIFGGGGGFGLLFFWYPDDYRYLYRFILPIIGNHWSTLGILSAWETYTVIVSWGIMQFCWFLLMLHCTSSRFWIQALTMRLTGEQAQNTNITICSRIPLQDQIRIYRYVQLLNSEYNRLNRYGFVEALKITTIVLHAQSAYCFVVMYGSIILFMYVGFSSLFFSWCVVEFITFSLAGTVYESSREFIRLFYLDAFVHVGKSAKIHAQSLSKIGVTVGDLYVFKRSTVICIIGIVCSLAANAVIMSWSNDINK